MNIIFNEIIKDKGDQTENEIEKFERDLNLDIRSQDDGSSKVEVIEDLNEPINEAERSSSQESSKGEIDLDYVQKAEIILTEERSENSNNEGNEGNTHNENTQDLLEQFYHKKDEGTSEPDEQDHSPKDRFQILDKFEEFEIEKEIEEDKKSTEEKEKDLPLGQDILELKGVEENMDPFKEQEKDKDEEDPKPGENIFDGIGIGDYEKLDQPQNPSSFDFMVQGDKISEEKNKQDLDKIEDLFAEPEPDHILHPGLGKEIEHIQKPDFNNLIDLSTPKNEDISHIKEKNSLNPKDPQQDHNLGELEDLISFDSNAPQQREDYQAQKPTPIKPYPGAQGDNSSDEDDYFDRSSQKIEDLFDFPSHSNPEESKNPAKSPEVHEHSESDLSPIKGSLQSYDEIFENEKLHELNSDISNEKFQSPESKKSSDFGRSPLQNDAFKTPMEIPGKFSNPEMHSSNSKEGESPHKESEDEDNKEEPLMHTDELIDLYSADPITGRAKEDESLEEDTDEEDGHNKDLQPAFEYEREESKRIEKFTEADNDQPRREFPIEKILPNLFPESKSQKAKTVKGHLIEEKWVENVSNSNSFKLEKKKEGSSISRKSVIGIFPGANFETNKSKELTSRYTDSFYSESDNNSKTNEKGNLETYSNQDIEEIMSKDKS